MDQNDKKRLTEREYIFGSSTKLDRNKYQRVHYWVYKRKKKATFCMNCNKFTKKLELANISGKYKYDVNDYLWLCRKCHVSFDKYSENYSGKKNPNFKGVTEDKKCLYCKSIFRKPYNIYCSKKCFANSLKNKMRYDCKTCGKVIQDVKSKNRKFCSLNCTYGNRVSEVKNVIRKTN